MRIDVWSDVVCPWCYIGKRRLERALAGFAHAAEVRVEWHSFLLDPSYPKGLRRPVHEFLAQKTGSLAQARALTERVKELAAAEGLAYDFDRAVMVATGDAHRLTHLAKAHGRGAQMHERLLRAHLAEGEVLDDPETLVRLGTEVGLPEAEVRRVVAGTEYADEVEQDLRRARRLGITGVPFFVLNDAYAVSGAQPVEVFRSALRTAHQAEAPAR